MPKSHDTESAPPAAGGPLADFRRAAAKQLAKIYTASSVQRAGLENSLLWARIRYSSIKAVGETVEVDVQVEDKDFIPSSVAREDLTPEAIAKYEAKALRAARYNVWVALNRVFHDDVVNSDRVLEALEALDYPERNRPSVQTSVEGYLRDEKGVEKRLVFTVPGTVTSEEAKTKFNDVTGPVPDAELIRSMFPTATKLAEPVHSVWARPVLTWPVYTHDEDDAS